MSRNVVKRFYSKCLYNAIAIDDTISDVIMLWAIFCLSNFEYISIFEIYVIY